METALLALIGNLYWERERVGDVTLFSLLDLSVPPSMVPFALIMVAYRIFAEEARHKTILLPRGNCLVEFCKGFISSCILSNVCVKQLGEDLRDYRKGVLHVLLMGIND